MALHKLASVKEGQCGNEEIKQFQTLLDGYQLHALSKEHFNAIVYSGQDAENMCCSCRKVHEKNDLDDWIFCETFNRNFQGQCFDYCRLAMKVIQHVRPITGALNVVQQSTEKCIRKITYAGKDIVTRCKTSRVNHINVLCCLHNARMIYQCQLKKNLYTLRKMLKRSSSLIISAHKRTC